MYDAELIKRLKRTNVSVDAEKTKERVELLWKSASNALKKQIEQDTGNARTSAYRAYQEGSISAKLAVSLSQRLNSDPYYLTGETDENNGYSAEVIERFLREKGYEKLLDEFDKTEPPKKRKPRKKASPALDQEAIPSDTSSMGNDTFKMDAEIGDNSTDSAPPVIDDNGMLAAITEDDMIALLHALGIRARVNDDAKRQLESIKQLLLF